MSGLGTTAVLGVLAVAILGPYLLMAGMALLAGGAMYVAGKAGTLIGKGIYNAHKVAENRRLEKARAELETVEGELKDIALKRHEALKEAEESLALEYEKAVEEREKRLEEAHSRLERADAKMEELVLELPKHFETRQKSIREDTEKEIGAFTEAMDKKCSELIAVPWRASRKRYSQSWTQRKPRSKERDRDISITQPSSCFPRNPCLRRWRRAMTAISLHPRNC